MGGDSVESLGGAVGTSVNTKGVSAIEMGKELVAGGIAGTRCVISTADYSCHERIPSPST